MSVIIFRSLAYKVRNTIVLLEIEHRHLFIYAYSAFTLSLHTEKFNVRLPSEF